jgi:PIN domain nuclease of toxin-antitoxin system
VSGKARQGKLILATSVGDYIRRQTRIGSISILPVYFPHAVGAGTLESAHKDPFDRMIAAQCLEEDLACVTNDAFFATCNVKTIW